MDERKKYIEELEECLPVVERISSLSKSIQDKNNKISEVKNEITPKENLVGDSLGLAFVISLFVLLVGSLAGAYFYYEIMKIDSGAPIIVVLFISILTLVVSYRFLYKLFSRRAAEKQIKAQEEKQQKIDKINDEIKNTIRSVVETLDSLSGQKAQSVIPQDYFYPAAVERFLFYFSNGHADTMKEALIEYDKFLHNQRMELEAARQSNAAERTAHASERTALASERAASAAESSVRANWETAQAARNTEFWGFYNAYLNGQQLDQLRK